MNVAPAGSSGLNFGWKLKEGFLTFSGGSQAGLTDPILDEDQFTTLLDKGPDGLATES